MVQEINDEELKAFTQSLLTRYGVDFTCYEKRSLKRRIIRILNLFELSSIHELWVSFLRDQSLIYKFMDEVSVGMTSMFRDPVLWRRLKPRAMEEFNRRHQVSVWHAGCSTGEEVYSFGILSREAGFDQKTNVLATDLNSTALQEAKAGCYHQVKMLENECNYREFNPYCNFSSYYASQNEYAVMDSSLVHSTNFRRHNLATDQFPENFDIIFCRNVMIYFDDAMKVRTLDKFYSSLNPQGYLIIGFYDTMHQFIDDSRFRLVDEEAKIYQRI